MRHLLAAMRVTMAATAAGGEPQGCSTALASVATGGAQGGDFSAVAAASSSGRFVAFFSDATNLDA